MWNKTEISKEKVMDISSKFGCDLITSSILTRRGITDGKDIIYFLENDKRFLHSPFLFNNMEDCVDRIMQAIEEEENVLIFGDRDVDGITSTTLLFENLTKLGMKATWRVPEGDDPYGLNIKAIDEFSKNFGSLIITVDCGISNNEEVKYASELGIDVIILDHHEAPPVLPSPAIIIDPKCADSGYPFDGISGCAVAFKVISALRFARSDFYKNEMCLLNVSFSENENCYVLEALKIQNLIEKERFTEKVAGGTVIFDRTKLSKFLSGQQIFVWNQKESRKMLLDCFGNGVDFNFLDVQSLASKILPQVANLSLSQLTKLSKIAKYYPEKQTELDSFFNIFVTIIEKNLRTMYKNWEEDEEKDLQLVTLAALADIMPLVNENRIFCRHGLNSINSGIARNGLRELISKQNNLIMKRLTSNDLSWYINPVLNAPGRLENASLGVKLFIEEDSAKREIYANQIIAFNEERKELGNKGMAIAMESVDQSISENSGKLCIIYDEKINKGITGIIASKISEQKGVPTLVMTLTDGGSSVGGSMRSSGKINCPDFLRNFEKYFINFGGHDAAAGFSLKAEYLNNFLSELKEFSSQIIFREKEKDVTIDAELPGKYMKTDLLNLIDKFEPYGNENPELRFLSKNLPVLDGFIMGKENQHLKLTLDCGETKCPALFWNEAERFHRDFDKGDRIDILFKIQRNTFNGTETMQLLLDDVRCSIN